MKKTLLLVATVLIAGFQAVKAQQEPQFTQYMFNTIYYNPGSAGLDGGTRFQFLGRSQWLGYQTSADGNGGITTGLLSVNSPWQALGGGVGFHAVLDNVGPVRQEEYQLSYSQHIELGSGKLGFGIRPGISGVTLDGNKLRPRDRDDQVLAAIKAGTSYRFDLGLGVFYQSSTWFGGVSAARLLAPKYDFGVSLPGISFANQAVPTVYGNLGYNIAVNDQWTVTPQALVRYFTQTVNTASLMADLNVMVDYDKSIFGGLSFRTGSADASLIVGANLLSQKNLRIIYSADLVTPAQTVEATSRSSHELSIAYQLPFVVRPGKPSIKTPRFRY